MSALPCRFEFAPSRQAAVLIAAGGGITAIATLIIPAPLPLRLLAATALIWLFYTAVRHLALLAGDKAVCGLEFSRHGEVIVLDKNGNHTDLGKISDCFVSPLLSTVVIVGKDRRYQVLMMPDSLPANDYRQLRVQLNINRQQKKIV